MKIFLASASLHPSYGGPAYSVARLGRALSDHGHEVGLWSADSSAPSIETRCRDLSGTIERALSEFGAPQILHDNGIWLPHNHALAGIARERRLPRVLSTRGMLEPWARRHKRIKKTIAWQVYQRRDIATAKRIHATSAPEAANIKLIGIDVPITVIPNGVDVPDFEFERKKEAITRSALFIGRIYPVKGLPMLINAWSRTRQAGWKLIIAGPDEAGHRRELEKQVAAATLDELVSFVGPVTGEKKNALYKQADVFILPTHSESFGLAIAEALAYALPVLTTTSAPWPDLESRGCGWLADPSVDGLTNKLRDVMKMSPEQLFEMGKRGRQYVAAEFSWDGVAKDFSRLYESLISNT